jgi:hypothetical protein
MFAREAEEQSKWNDGFKAGIAEVVHEMESAVSKNEDLEGPTKQWVAEFSAKLLKKYS